MKVVQIIWRAHTITWIRKIGFNSTASNAWNSATIIFMEHWFYYWPIRVEVGMLKLKLQVHQSATMASHFQPTSQLTSPSGGCACEFVLPWTHRRWLHTCLKRYLFIHPSRVRQLCVKYLAQGYKGSRLAVGFEPATLGLWVTRSTTEGLQRSKYLVTHILRNPHSSVVVLFESVINCHSNYLILIIYWQLSSDSTKMRCFVLVIQPQTHNTAHNFSIELWIRSKKYMSLIVISCDN